MRFRVGVSLRFPAAHRLVGYVGRCGCLHGHTYTVEVEVEGDKLNELNMLIDILELKEILRDIVSRYDHSYLNEVLGVDNPTAEVLALRVREEVSARLRDRGLRVRRVRVYDSPDSYAEVVDD